MKTKLTMIISLFLVTGFANGQERGVNRNDEDKIKEIRENPDKYMNDGGVAHDQLIKKPKKTSQIVGDGFIIHPNPNEDFEIHSLNQMNNQTSDEFKELKIRTLQYMEQKFDERVKSAPEEIYRTPQERNMNK
jgi:hypothetical protein